MKPLIFSIAILFSVSSFAQSEQEAIKAVVSSAYIGGIHNGGPVDDIRKGFHPSFHMLSLVNNDVKSTPLEDWIAAIEKNRQTARTNGSLASGEFVEVSVNGTVACVVLNLSRDGKKIFTDNLLLYKFQEGWRIVSKAFYRY